MDSPELPELQTKYQRLATEYAKLRSQVPVLKKAVLDEQESSKMKDQNLRKCEQEIDSLSFRNKQLTSRVEVLQQELDGTPMIKGKKTKKNAHLSPNTSPAHVGASVLGEELQNKIKENEILHMQVTDATYKHESEVNTLKNRLAVLESDASRHQEVLKKTQDQNKTLLETLTNDKAILEVKFQSQNKDMKDANEKAEKADRLLKEVSESLSLRLETAEGIIKEKLPFNDMANTEWNALNIPPYNREHQGKAKDLSSQAAILLKELIQGLLNLHSYCEQRARIYPSDEVLESLSDVNKKLSHHLHENAAFLRQIELTFRTFLELFNDSSMVTLETATGLQGYAQSWSKYVAYLDKLLPYILLSIEEECQVSSCPQTLASKNLEVYDSWRELVTVFGKLDTYIQLLAFQSHASCDHPASNQVQIFQLLSKSFSDLHIAIKNLSKHFNAKVSLEHQLPTISEKLKTTNECIVSSLVNLVTTSNKISSFMSGNLDFFTESLGLGKGTRSHPDVAMFRTETANYLASISRPCPETVPYEEAISNRKTLLSSTESRESLAMQVTKLQERATKLEQDKEHWMLESQLMTMKYQKQLERIEQLEKMLSAQNGGDSQQRHAVEELSKAEPVASGALQTVTDPSTLGTISANADKSLENDSREELIKGHFNERITAMMSQVQIADSKAMNFSAECRALHKRLGLMQNEKETLKQDLDQSIHNIAQFKDELQTTTRSYEGQLSMMSEHLAGMNEKLATQKDEIEALKYELQIAKGQKKGRLK